MEESIFNKIEVFVVVTFIAVIVAIVTFLTWFAIVMYHDYKREMKQRKDRK